MSFSTVTLQKDESIRPFVCDSSSGDLYNNDDFLTLRVKFSLIALTIPYYTIGNMGYHVYTLVEGKITESLWDIVSDAIYGIAVLFSVLSGMVSPLEGRKLEAIVENHWQKGVSKHQDCRIVQNGQACYLAYCFQTCGNINDRGTIRQLTPAPSAH